jgi:hypothetical protein
MNNLKLEISNLIMNNVGKIFTGSCAAAGFMFIVYDNRLRMAINAEAITATK